MCLRTTVAVIGSGWLLSSNKILPMLGTLGQALSPVRASKHADEDIGGHVLQKLRTGRWAAALRCYNSISARAAKLAGALA